MLVIKIFPFIFTLYEIKSIMTQTSFRHTNRLLKAKIKLNKASLQNDIIALAYCIELAKTIEHGSLKDVSLLFNFYKKTI